MYDWSYKRTKFKTWKEPILLNWHNVKSISWFLPSFYQSIFAWTLSAFLIFIKNYFHVLQNHCIINVSSFIWDQKLEKGLSKKRECVALLNMQLTLIPTITVKPLSKGLYLDGLLLRTQYQGWFSVLLFYLKISDFWFIILLEIYILDCSTF